MVNQQIQIPDWDSIARMPATQRVPLLKSFYEELAKLPEEVREPQLMTAVKLEYGLPDQLLAAAVDSRLHAWMAMDQEGARAVAKSYDKVMDKMPGEAAMRRAMAVQTAAHAMDEADVEKLRGLIPSVVKQIPSLATTHGTTPLKAVAAPEAAKPKRGWRPWGRA